MKNGTRMNGKFLLFAIILLSTLALTGVVYKTNLFGIAAYAQKPKGPSVAFQAGGNPPACALIPSDLSGQIEASAPWYCPINQQIYDSWINDLPIAGAALTLAFAIAALIYLIGVLIKSDKVRNFGVGELYEATASAIIVIIFLYVCAVVFGLVPSNVVGTINPYPVAFNLMLSTIYQAETVYNSIYQVFLYTSLTYQVGIEVDLPNPLFQYIGQAASVGFKIWNVLADIFVLEPSRQLASFITDGILAIYAQYYLLEFFAVAAIPCFLVPGVIFRAILPTRSLGGILIALSIGFYLVMPSLFAVAYYLTAPSVLQQLSTSSQVLNRFGGNGVSIGELSSGSPLVTQLTSIQSAITNFWLLMIFYPLLIIAVTYAFVVELARFLGQAPNMTGRLRTFV